MNYYNDNDAYAAQWLRNLVAVDALPAGAVDQRSIADIKPGDLDGYDACHFFAGIGGWPYALDLTGWPADRPVWTGSCPCQPFSSAGKQGGGADERHLWPQWFRLIRECRPDTILGEQVAGAVGFGWLDRVFADLEALGYACGAAVLGAHSVGAPHIRQRLFWVADTGRQRWEGRPICLQPGQPRQAGPEAAGSGATGGLGESESEGSQGQRLERGAAEGGLHRRQPRLSGDSLWADAVWLPCLDGKARRTQPGIFPLAARLPAAMDGLGPISRVGVLKGAGNSIVPQAAAEFIRIVMDVC